MRGGRVDLTGHCESERTAQRSVPVVASGGNVQRERDDEGKRSHEVL